MIHQPTGRDSPSWTLDREGYRVPALEGNARIEEIAGGLRSQAGVRMGRPDLPGHVLDTHLGTVHDADYLRFLDTASKEASPGMPVEAPQWSAPGVVPDTPVSAGSAVAARSAAATALTAASRLESGAAITYALCRPPGHHAGRRSMGGYCYLNNAAAAVSYLRVETAARVGVLDIDFHYGNGTALIVAEDEKVWLESLHASPVDHFPWQASNPANARHRHHEFRQPPSALSYLGKLDHALDSLVGQCDLIVVSLGYDIVWGDPHGDWFLPPVIFRGIGARLAAAGLPICVIQEGGYAKRQLGRCASAFAAGITAGIPSEASLS